MSFIRDMVKENWTSLMEINALDAPQYKMNQWLARLEELAVGYEARWGVGRLEKLAPPALSEKWQRQMVKINDAIKNSELNVMQDLFNGTIRGYEALEEAAIIAGHKAYGPPETWHYRMPSGKDLIVCATHKDAVRAAASYQDLSGVEIWSLEEVANLIEARGKIGDSLPRVKNQKAEFFDFAKGDDIPF